MHLNFQETLYTRLSIIELSTNWPLANLSHIIKTLSETAACSLKRIYNYILEVFSWKNTSHIKQDIHKSVFYVTWSSKKIPLDVVVD